MTTTKITARIDAALEEWQASHDGQRADILYLGMREACQLDREIGMVMFSYKQMEISLSGLSGIKFGMKYGQ